jgi:hypothetical protein
MGGARSRIVNAPPDVNYFHVQLKDGQSWRYAAPDGHSVTWLAVDRGSVRLEEDGRVLRQQIALFTRSRGVIQLQAEGESSFVLGSSKRHSNAHLQGSHLPIDATLEALMPGEVRAGERPDTASPGRPLRTNSMKSRLGDNEVPVLGRRLARTNAMILRFARAVGRTSSSAHMRPRPLREESLRTRPAKFYRGELCMPPELGIARFVRFLRLQ